MSMVPANVTRSLGGGRLYYKSGNDWIEFGEVKEFKYSINVETTDAMAHDGCMEEVVDTAVTKWDGKLSFSTQNMNTKNFELSSLGDSEDVSYAAGDELPDGTTAAAAITVKKVQAGKKLLNKEAIKYVAAKCTNQQRLVVEFPSVVVTPSGDKQPQNKDWMQLSFDGKILAPSGGEPVYTEYLIPAA